VWAFFLFNRKEISIMTTQEHIIREAVVLAPANNILPSVIEQTAKAVFDKFSDRLKASLNGRQERALKLALAGHVMHKAKRIFTVRSQYGAHSYLVDLDRKFCNCPDSQKGYVCKHRLAAYLVEQAKAANMEITPKPEHHLEYPRVSERTEWNPEEDSLERARFVLERARSDMLRQAIVYASILDEGEDLPVEVVSIEGDGACVRALPKMKEDKLVPQFPFEGRVACAKVLAQSLFNIRIYS
jgi:hypothetical protein